MINHQQLGTQNNLIRPTTNIIYVQGDAGAKGYPVTNGYTMLLMDSEEQRFYIKQTDALGIPTMRTFEFNEIKEQSERKEYITKEDFEQFKEEIKALLEAPKSKVKAGAADA